MALGLVAGLLVSVAVAVDDDSGDAEAASPISDDFTGGTNPYNGGTGWSGATWVEANDGAGQPWSTGQIQATATPGLLFGATGNGLGANTTITRDVDLAAFNTSNPGATGAKVSFTLLDNDGNDDLQLRFLDAADNPTVIADFGGSPNLTRLSYIIPNDLLIADGAIQFGRGGGDWDNDTIEIGDLVIENAVANPDLADSCGIDVQIVLDESGSIFDFTGSDGLRGEVAVRNGVVAFLNGLLGSGSQVRTHEFSANARDVEVDPGGGFTDGYELVDQGLIDGYFEPGANPTGYFRKVGTNFTNPPPDSTLVRSFEPRDVNGTAPNNGQVGENVTNWEAGLEQALDSTTQAPLVLFITDGVPNTVGDDGTSPPNSTNGDGAANSAAAAVDQIDELKENGKVIAVGVGQGFDTTNLARLANFIEPTQTPEIWDGTNELNLSTVDVLSVTDFAKLQEALAEAAENFCSQQLVINKVDENHEPFDGVPFTATVNGVPDGQELSYNYLEPQNDPKPTTNPVLTGSQGTPPVVGQARFEWSALGVVPRPSSWTSTAEFTETIPTGYTVDEGDPGTCAVVPARDQQPPPVLSVDVNGSQALYKLDDGNFQFEAGDVVTCTIKNIEKPGQLIVRKATASQSTNDTFGFFGAGGAIDGDITTVDGQGTSELSANLPLNGSYEITEDDIPDGWALADVSCDNDSGTKDLANNKITGVTVQAGAPTICTFTNTKTAVTIAKDAPETATPTGPGTYQVEYTVTVSNPGSVDAEFNVRDVLSLSPGTTPTNITVTGPASLPPIDNPYVENTDFYDEDQPIKAGEDLEFTVLVDFTVNNFDVLVPECDGRPNNGAFNTASVTSPGSVGPPASDCADIPEPGLTVEKVAQGDAVPQGGGFVVNYDIVVTNGTDLPTAFELTDTPEFAVGAEIQSLTVTRPDLSEETFNAPFTTVTLDSAGEIGGPTGTEQTYKVSIAFTLQDDFDPALRDCGDDPGKGDATYNTTLITFGGGSDDGADCANIPDPALTVEKIAQGDAVPQGGGFVVSYDIVVTNGTDQLTAFELTDTPEFAVGADIQSLTVTRPDASEETFNAPFTTVTLDDSGEIGGPTGTQQTYKVSIAFTLQDDFDPALRDCGDDPGKGDATYNTTLITFSGGSDDGADCANIPDPGLSIVKELINDDQPVYNEPTDDYTVSYTLTVTNNGPGATTYNVSDTPDFATGTTLTKVVVTLPDGGGTIDDYLAKLGDDFYAVDQNINAGQANAKVFTVEVTFDVPPTLSNEVRECADSNEPGGFGAYNSAEVTRGGVFQADDDDCADIPNPDLTPNKFVSADPVYVGNGQWFIEYTITVESSETGGPGQYDLDDITAFSPGVVADSLVFVSVAPQSIFDDGEINANFGVDDARLASDVDIAPDTIHTYKIGATVSTNYEGDVTYVECIPDAPEPDEGLYNSATVTVNGEPLDPVDACENLPGDLRMEKDDGGAIAIAGGDPFTYTLTVTNVGGVSTGEPVIVTDELPEQFEWVSFPDSDPACVADTDSVITCTLAPGVVDTGGESFSFEVSARAPAGTAPSSEGYENLSFVDSPLDPPPNPPVCPGSETVELVQLDVIQEASAAVLVEILDELAIIADPDNNVACDRTPIEDAEIEVTKTDDVNDPDTVVNGEQFTYTIAVENTGTSTVEDVKIDDDLPAALSYVSIAAGAGWTCNDANPIACTYGPALDPGQTTTDVVVTVQVTESFIGESITNVVDASALLKVQGEEKEVTDSDDEVTPLEPTLDVGAFEPTCVGEFPYIEYTIVPKGFEPSSSATIEILDADMQLVETLNDQPLSGQILWPGASLDPADWPGWQLENGVWVEDGTDQFLRDGLFFRVTVNPTATTALVPYPAASEVCANPEQTEADLEILKAATTVTAPQGSSFEWILEVINNGPDLATEIVVTDNVPANLQVTGVASNTFDCTRQGNNVRCTLDELAVGASAFIGIDVNVPIGTVGNVPNTADVSGRVPDPNPNNNADTDVVNVPAGVLPDTGSDMGNTLRIAGLILTAGLALVVLTLRRRREQMAS